MNEPSDPKDAPSRRRSLFARAGGLALRGAGAALARLREHDDAGRRRGRGGGGGKGILGDPTAGGPVDASGIPLARRDYPVTLPRVGEPSKSGAKPETRRRAADLQLRRLPQSGGPQGSSASRRASSVRVTTFDTLDEAFTKLEHRPAAVRRHLHLAGPALAARRAPAHPAAELRADPEPAQNVWPELHSPFYDVGPRYSVPYTVYTTGIGWRND